MFYPELIVKTTSLISGQKKTLKGRISLKSIDVPLGNIPVVSNPVYDMQLIVVDDEVLVKGKVHTSLEYPCVRCLETVSMEIDGVIEAHYISEEKTNLKSEEEMDSFENVIYYGGSEIDLYDRIIEAIAVEVPEYVVCTPHCKGLCPYCGANLNEEPDHECAESKKAETNSVFDVLKDLKDNL